MSEKKLITHLAVITDTDTDMHTIGDIDGGNIDEEWLEGYIESYGTQKLLDAVALISYQIKKADMELKRKKSFRDRVDTMVKDL